MGLVEGMGGSPPETGILRLVLAEDPDGDAPGDAALTLFLVKAPVTLTVGELAVVTVFPIELTGGEMIVRFFDSELVVFPAVLTGGELDIETVGELAVVTVFPIELTGGEMIVRFFDSELVVFPAVLTGGELDIETVAFQCLRNVAVVILEEHLIVSQLKLALPLDLYKVVAFGNLNVVDDRCEPLAT